MNLLTQIRRLFILTVSILCELDGMHTKSMTFWSTSIVVLIRMSSIGSHLSIWFTAGGVWDV